MITPITKVTIDAPNNNDSNYSARTVSSGVARAAFTALRRTRYGMLAQASSTVTFSTSNTKEIALVEIRYYYYYGDEVTTSSGSYSRTDAVGTWTPTTETTSAEITYGSEARITSIDIYYYN